MSNQDPHRLRPGESKEAIALPEISIGVEFPVFGKDPQPVAEHKPLIKQS